MTKENSFKILEHQCFGLETCREVFQDKERAERFFDALKDFAKKHSYLLGFKDENTLRVKNYVGVIYTPYGMLEILPKCFDVKNLNREKQNHNTPKLGQIIDREKGEDKPYKIENFTNQQGEFFKIKNLDLIDPLECSRAFLIKCLQYFLPRSKQANHAFLQNSKVPLFDIFIQMFCQEFQELCNKGIYRHYVEVEENRFYLKGKLLFNQQNRYNFIHKERFFTASDEYLLDTPQNRLIKTTLEFLKNKATSYSVSNQVLQALEIFGDVPRSKDYYLDFKSCVNSRHFSHYDEILQWCKIFLDGESFDFYGGSNRVYALLFPMELLFEKYVASMLKQSNRGKDFLVQAQKSNQFLLEKNNKKFFQMRIDLYIKTNGKAIVADTKWKQLNQSLDGGVSQGDLYQLFAYALYHEVNEVWLIYPEIYSDKMPQTFKMIQEGIHESNYSFGAKKIKLKIIFAPLF